MKFLINSEDSELLLALEESQSLLDLSDIMKRDISVLSRRLNKIKLESGLVEKINGKWFLTEDGLNLNQWSKKAINEQNFIFSQKKSIRIATTREFASRILIPHLNKLNMSQFSVEIIATDGLSEKMLLDNAADIAIDCGTPYHPDIRFKKIAKELMLIISSKNYFKKHKSLKSEYYLHFTRNHLGPLQEELNMKLIPKYTFNDLSSLRSAILNDLGFGLIPYYVVKEDLEKNLVHNFDIHLKTPMSFGVWWRQDFKNIELITELSGFLKKLKIG